MRRGQLTNDEEQQAENTQRGENADVVGREPVFALAGVEYDLQRSKSERQKTDAGKIDGAFGAANVGRIVDKTAHHHQGNQADRKVEIKNPAPAVVVGDPSAKRRPKNRRQQNAEAESGHSLPVTFFGKSFEQDRLRQRLQAAASEPLQNAKHNQHGKAGCEAAAERGYSKSGDAGQQQPLAAKIIRQPS